MKPLNKETDFSCITVVIPTFNEEIGIGSTMLELKKFLKDSHFLVVDGNSTDKTIQIATVLDAEVVKQEGRGKGRAIAHAFKYIDSGTRYVVFIDGDFTYPADSVYKMIKILDNNLDVGMVTGNRFNSHFRLKNMSNAYHLGNRLIALTQRWLNGIKLRDPLTGLRIIRWDILKDWNPKSEGFDIEAELNYYVCNKLYRIVEIPISYRKRLGKKKLSFRHGFTILKRILIQSLK